MDSMPVFKTFLDLVSRISRIPVDAGRPGVQVVGSVSAAAGVPELQLGESEEEPLPSGCCRRPYYRGRGRSPPGEALYCAMQGVSQRNDEFLYRSVFFLLRAVKDSFIDLIIN